jgi:outer membrane protein assembly factor BamA
VGRLQDLYRRQGFFHTQITPRVETDENREVSVELQIEEGPWVKVAEINMHVAPTARPLDFGELEDKQPLKTGDRLIAENY